MKPYATRIISIAFCPSRKNNPIFYHMQVDRFYQISHDLGSRSIIGYYVPKTLRRSDWSGKPYERNDLFVFCVVALGDAEAWDSSCRQLRQRLRMPPNREFHARDMGKGSHKLEFLTAGQEAGMRVGACIVDTSSENEGFADLTHESVAMELLHQFLPVYPFRSFWYDKGDLKGEKAEKAFETEICRYNRTLYPSSPLETKCRKSHNSNLIQLADVMAYAFRTLAIGTLREPQLRSLLKEINRDERNIIIRR